MNKNKYSLWIVPKAEAGAKLQATIDHLADENQATRFVPHLTVVANIFADDSELASVEQKLSSLTQNIGQFGLRLDGYGFLNETFRCLYTLAEPSVELTNAYDTASEFFPQVQDEHFAAMPHLSVLYGDYSPEYKQNTLLPSLPAGPIDFTVESFDLYRTNDPISSWELVKEFPLSNET